MHAPTNLGDCLKYIIVHTSFLLVGGSLCSLLVPLYDCMSDVYNHAQLGPVCVHIITFYVSRVTPLIAVC